MLRFRKKAPRGCILALFVGVQRLISGTAGEVCLYVYLMYIGSQWSGVHTSLCSTKQDIFFHMNFHLTPSVLMKQHSRCLISKLLRVCSSDISTQYHVEVSLKMNFVYITADFMSAENWRTNIKC